MVVGSKSELQLANLTPFQRLARAVSSDKHYPIIKVLGLQQKFAAISKSDAHLSAQSRFLSTIAEYKPGDLSLLTAGDWIMLRGVEPTPEQAASYDKRDAVVAFFSESGLRNPGRTLVNSLVEDLDMLREMEDLSDDEYNLYEQVSAVRSRFLECNMQGKSASQGSSPLRVSQRLHGKGQVPETIYEVAEDEVQHEEQVAASDEMQLDGDATSSGAPLDGQSIEGTLPETDVLLGNNPTFQEHGPEYGGEQVSGGMDVDEESVDGSWRGEPIGSPPPSEGGDLGGGERGDLARMLARIEGKLDHKVEGLSRGLSRLRLKSRDSVRDLQQVVIMLEEKNDQLVEQNQALEERLETFERRFAAMEEMLKGSSSANIALRMNQVERQQGLDRKDLDWLIEEQKRFGKRDQICLFRKDQSAEVTVATIKQALLGCAAQKGFQMADTDIHKVYRLNDGGLWGVKFHNRAHAYWTVNNKRLFEAYGLYPSHDKTKAQNEVQSAERKELTSMFTPELCPIFSYSDNEHLRVLVAGSFKPFGLAMDIIRDTPRAVIEAEVRKYKADGPPEHGEKRDRSAYELYSPDRLKQRGRGAGATYTRGGRGGSYQGGRQHRGYGRGQGGKQDLSGRFNQDNRGEYHHY